MAIFDLFSKRQRALRCDVPDVYTYSDLPNALRVQCHGDGALEGARRERNPGQFLERLGGTLAGQKLGLGQVHCERQHSRTVLDGGRDPFGEGTALYPPTMRYSVTARWVTTSTTWRRSGSTSAAISALHRPHAQVPVSGMIRIRGTLKNTVFVNGTSE